MDYELELLAARLEAAKIPEDLFGELSGDAKQMLADAKSLWQRFIRITHPDRHTDPKDKEVANKAFSKVTELWNGCQRKITQGTYGKDSSSGRPVVIRSRRGEYTVEGRFAQGDICDLFDCSFPADGGRGQGIFKVARHPTNNSFVSNEAKVLRHLLKGEHEQFRAYVPNLVDSFAYRDPGTSVNRAANVFSVVEGLYSLKEVRESRTNRDGIDRKDMAWMFRRLLVALGFAHRNGVIHGAVTPEHVLIHPEKHGLVLVDWTASVLNPESSGERVRLISNEYKGWYPPEVVAKEEPTAALDIYMAARCMVYLLAGNPVTGELPHWIPRSLKAFFNGCTPKGVRARPSDAWVLKDEFDELIERLWGTRKFRPFAMPPRK